MHREEMYNENHRHATGLILEQVGYERCRPLHAFGPSTRDHYLFHYVASGRGVLRCRSGEYSVNAHEIFMIMPDEVTFYQADEEDPWYYFWFGLSGHDMKEFVRSLGFTNRNRVVAYHCFNEYAIDLAIKKMVKHRIETLSDRLYETGRIYELAAWIRKSREQHGKIVFSEEPERYLQVACNYIDKNFMRHLDVSVLADYLGIDRTHLFRVFDRSYGCGPKAYIINKRMEKAKELLKTSRLNIKIIASSVGYSDQYLFSKIFKKNVGMTPTQYRKQ